MKQVVIVALGVLVSLTSCVRKQVALEAQSQRDSLSVVVSAKDSLINAVFEDINAISENLAQIKVREELITVAGAAEGGVRPMEQINNDIAAIDRLLEENRAKIASLQGVAARLRKANVQIGALEKTIGDLNAQLGDKTTQIGQLRDKLAKMGIEVESLTEQVAARSAEVVSLSDEKIELEERMNTVYYIVGEEKELRDAQIINKEGFIGRTLVVNKGANRESFSEADARLLSEVSVGYKKVTVVSTHPEESYELVIGPDKTVEKLLISDPDRFWESSKILVISYK